MINAILYAEATKVKQEMNLEDGEFSPKTTAMIASLDDSEESRELVQGLRNMSCSLALVALFLHRFT